MKSKKRRSQYALVATSRGRVILLMIFILLSITRTFYVEQFFLMVPVVLQPVSDKDADLQQILH
jgi:hypothetical protein